MNDVTEPVVTPVYRVATITPDLAREWLKRNTRNRVLNERRVRALADAMQRGEWHENGDAIRFSASGVLLDGQTRLAAVVESRTSIRSLVAEGLPDEAQITMDVGARRTFAAVLQIQGVKHAGHIAALARMVFDYETGQIRSHERPPSHTQLQAVVDKNLADLEVSLKVAKSIRRQLPMSVTVLGVAHWLFRQIDEEDCSFFFDRIRDGQGLVEGDPVLVLRKRVLIDATNERNQKLKPFHLLALLIKAWNAYRMGEQLNNLRWRTGGARPEPFPEPK